jgi:hypothetical protein
MNRFITGDCAPRSPKGAKMLACADPSLDGPVVLFQDVIKDTALVDAGISPPEHRRL